MSRFLPIFIAALFCIGTIALSPSATGQGSQQDQQQFQQQSQKQLNDQDILEDAFDDVEAEQDTGEAGMDEEAPPEDEEPLDEEAPFEEEQPPLLPRLPFQRRSAEKPPVFVGEAGDEEPTDEARKIMIDGLVTLNYVFDNSPESFIVNYHFRIEGETKAKTAVLRGDAIIDAKVEGVLAKWPTGECTLNINVTKAPFQVTFRRGDDDNANIDLKFTKPIMETWESTCNFGDAGAKPFVTKGDPEKWLERALNKTSPPMNRLVATLNPDEKTTTKFIINNHQINDPPLGTIEAEGTGMITIIPAYLTTGE